MTVMRLKLILFLYFLSFVAANANSIQAQGPEHVVKQTTLAILEEVKGKKASFQSNQSKLEDYLKQHALPHWDIRKMVIYAIGSDNWRKASQGQKEALQEALHNTILRYFVVAFSMYKGQSITFNGSSGFSKKDDGWVKSTVSGQLMPALPVDYRIRKDKKGDWRVIDIRIAGVSLMKNKRNEFMRLIKSNGIDGLVVLLEEKNKKILTRQYYHRHS